MAKHIITGTVNQKLFDDKLLKVVETIHRVKKDGTAYTFKRVWSCWFDEPQDIVVITGSTDTWVEIRSEHLDAKERSYTTSSGETKSTIEFSLNKCELVSSQAPKSDDWLGDYKTRQEDALTGYDGDTGLPF